MIELVILPEIEDLLYPLKPEELANLETSIREEGVRDPLVIWKREDEDILIDGHHRYAIAKKHQIDFRTVTKSFESLEDVLDWVDKNQLGRRNLTDEERALTVGRIYQRVRDQRAAARVNPEENAEPAQNGGRTADKVAEEWNVSSGTIKRSSDFASAIQCLKESGDNGEVAAQRILHGEIKDAMSELPIAFKNQKDRFVELADGLAGGAKKIREVIPKPKPKVHNITPSVGADVEIPDGRNDESIAKNATFRTAMSGIGVGEEDEEFYAGVEQAAKATQGILRQEPSAMELQSNLLQCFACFDVLRKVEPAKLWGSLPRYVKEQVQPGMSEVAQWLADFAQCAGGE